MPPPSVTTQLAEIHRVETRRVQQRVEQRVHARNKGERILLQLLHERRKVARIRDQHVPPAEQHEQQAVRREPEDVIQRQRRDERARLLRERRPDPGLRLQHVGDDVPMREHRALRHARGAAGVLKERDVLVLRAAPALSACRLPPASASRKSIAPSMCHGFTCLRLWRTT